MTRKWRVGETRTFQYHPVGSYPPEGAIDHGLSPKHHGRHSYVIELPESKEKSVVYVRRGNRDMPIEVVVGRGHGIKEVVEITDERALFLATELLSLIDRRKALKKK